MPPKTPLSETLPPLIMGTSTFNSQYNQDAFTLPTTALVQQALDTGVRAFDTSPYYGPAEDLLGQALSTEYVRKNYPRSSYHLLTKVGRVAASSFDYSPRWIRKSIRRSLQRLRTEYLDVVYCHDVEFLDPQEVLGAVRELRRIRDESANNDNNTTKGPVIRYIGISGYPVDVLVEIAEMVLRETGEPLDAVMSYANFTIQNTRLLSAGLDRLLAAGVDVVPNGSPLGMGLLRRSGVPVGGMGDFHPAPAGLREATHRASEWVDAQGREEEEKEKKIEIVAIRFAFGEWLREGARAGAMGPPPLAVAGSSSPENDSSKGDAAVAEGKKRLGISVMGVSYLDELHETLQIWRSVINGLNEHDEEAQRQRARVLSLAKGIRSVLGPEWVDYAWHSPSPDFVNSLSPEHIALRDSADDDDA